MNQTSFKEGSVFRGVTTRVAVEEKVTCLILGFFDGAAAFNALIDRILLDVLVVGDMLYIENEKTRFGRVYENGDIGIKCCVSI